MLDLNIVPVVMGGGNYSRDAPEYSVINVKDFPSAKALADYLTYLTRNPVSYTNNYIRTANIIVYINSAHFWTFSDTPTNYICQHKYSTELQQKLSFLNTTHQVLLLT